ncbi:MAG: membrane protein insertase YidC, partial [Prevotella sp.]|nr:membrane protein insertase YidC [Prevotella sp.]
MDKNTITGFILIVAVLIGFSWWNKPSEEQMAQMRQQDSLQEVARKKAEETKKAAELAATEKKEQKLAKAQQDSSALFHSALSGSAQDVVLKNKKLELTLSTKGGTVTKALIRGYKDQKGNPDVVLFDEKEQQLKFMLAGKEQNIISSDLFFTPSNVTDSTVTMTAMAAPGQELALEYRLGPDYLLHMSLRTSGMSGLFSPTTNEMDIQWDEKCRQQERGYSFENRYAAITYHHA